MNQQEQHLAARDAGLAQLAWPMFAWVALWDATTVLRAAWLGSTAAATHRDATADDGVSRIDEPRRRASDAPSKTTPDYGSAA